MNIAIAGAGYVGLVTAACLAEIGHTITCYDIDERKIQSLNKGVSPIYEPGLEHLIRKGIKAKTLTFTTDAQEAFAKNRLIMIAVGTPENEDGTANLDYIEDVAITIARNIQNHTIVVTKSTVPVGTNELIGRLIHSYKPEHLKIEVASNPEFLREGSAIHDTFHGDRIVIGAESEAVLNLLEQVYQPLNIPITKTDIRSAEMIKYAANAFLATKISFINEIANICEKLGANIEDVAFGIGQDKRIGSSFLRAGLGYGGSCFPKDTKALVQIAGDVEHRFDLLESVIEVNNKQRLRIVEKARNFMGSLEGKRIAILGLAFKPETDDIREAAALDIIAELMEDGADLVLYDPIVGPEVCKHFGYPFELADSPEKAIANADAVFIVTEWMKITETPLRRYRELMRRPTIFDGRNCYSLEEAEQAGVTYFSVGRAPIINYVTTLEKL